MRDQSDADNDVNGGNIGVLYDLSKRTTLYGFASVMKNKNNAGFVFSGSAGPAPNLSGPDVNGRRLTGYQAGIVHRF
jgi:predicted porin